MCLGAPECVCAEGITEARAEYERTLAQLLAAYEEARRQGDERAMDRLADAIGTTRAEWEAEE